MLQTECIAALGVLSGLKIVEAINREDNKVAAILKEICRRGAKTIAVASNQPLPKSKSCLIKTMDVCICSPSGNIFF